MAISIMINAGNSASNTTVTATGYVQHNITDAERTAFNIQDDALKNILASSYGGNRPDDAYLCDPTEWGNLFAEYSLAPVQTTLSVTNATITDVSSAPSILASTVFANNSTVPAEYNTGITQEVTVSTESNWSNTSTVEIGQSVSYGLSFLGSGAEGETSMTYSESWETGGSQSEDVTVGSSSGVTVTLQPGEQVIAELSAVKSTATVEITYQMTLSGEILVNFSSTYNGHHFWFADMNQALATANAPMVITSTQTVVIDYYSTAVVTLRNQEGKTLAAHPAGTRPAPAPALSGKSPRLDADKVIA